MKTVVDSRLLELARVFVKLGLVSFGGPAAHIAMMEDEVVRRRHWLTREAFLDLLGAGVIAAVSDRLANNAREAPCTLGAISLGTTLMNGSGVTAAALAPPVGLTPLFWFFCKVGAVLFGSGYVLLAFLRADLVDRWQWLTEAQLLDAIAVGQITPGPVFSTATFIGYLLGGTPAAVVATCGIFLPAFLFVAISGPLIPRIRRSPAAGA